MAEVRVCVNKKKGGGHEQYDMECFVFLRIMVKREKKKEVWGKGQTVLIYSSETGM